MSALAIAPPPVDPLLAQAPASPPALGAPAPDRGAEPDGARSFSDALRRSAMIPPGQPRSPGAEPDPAREAAQELVAITFVQPILAQLRESNMAAEPFAPGDAERRFGPLWDAAIAQRIVQARGFGLVDAVARSVRTQGDGAAPAPREDPAHARTIEPATRHRPATRPIDLDA